MRQNASPSSRRAWIEMVVSYTAYADYKVALLAEGVDRNGLIPSRLHLQNVALLAEGVDRNSAYQAFYVVPEVALLAEGVDRNMGEVESTPWMPGSPSSRRAWIEIW